MTTAERNKHKSATANVNWVRSWMASTPPIKIPKTTGRMVQIGKGIWKEVKL